MSWIKLRTNLVMHPKCVALSSRLGVSRCHAVGLLACAWSVADQFADDDGRLEMSADALDSIVEHPGFSTALQAVGWLLIEEDAVIFPRYPEHNGTTAKSRAENTRRQQASRSSHAAVARARR